MKLVDFINRHKKITLCIVLGVVLLCLGWLAERREVSQQETLDVRLQAYTDQLEQKIEDMLCELNGVGDVHVLVTLEGSASYIYATNTSNGNSASHDYVIIDQGDGQKPVLLQELLSDIRGISVVCKNGERPEIQRKIIGLLCTGFGIPSSRVFVAGK